MKIRMIAEGSYKEKDYVPGKDYTVTNEEYEALKQSCIIINGTGVPVESMPDKSMSPKEKRRIRKFDNILVVKSYGIGNIVNITPTIIKLREVYPDAVIDLMVEPQYENVLKGWSVIDDIVTQETYKDRYDLIIGGVPGKIDMNQFNSNKLYTMDQTLLSEMHEVELNIKVLKKIGIVVDEIPDAEFKVKRVSGYDDKYIGICAGWSTVDNLFWKRKNWGYKNYAELIKLLLDKFKQHKILIFGIEGDDKILKYVDSKRIKNLCGKYDIQQSAYILRKCEFLVCNDTGLGHIASALKVPVYTIFGATSEVKNRPYNTGIVIKKDIECRPCQYNSDWSNCNKWECMNIKPEEVFRVIVDEDEENYTLGLLMATYKRYDALINTLDSILASDLNNKNVKLSINDDGSNDDRIDNLIELFSESFKGKVEYINHEENWGKIRYWKTLHDGFKNLLDCKYIMFLPDDCLLNRYSYAAIMEGVKYMNDDIKALSFFKDIRCQDNDIERDLYSSNKKYNEYFYIVNGLDGFMSVIDKKHLKNFNWKVDATDQRTKIWWGIINSLRKYKILLYCESLIEHTGNVDSRFWSEIRNENRIYGMNLNLWEKPKILKRFEYSKEWYENTYHAAGDYRLTTRDYQDVMGEWERSGYRDRLYKVFDDIGYNLQNKFYCLEIACHHGKTVFWLLEKYLHLNYDAFDFSKIAVDWCQKYNPYPDRSTFKIGDVTNIPFKKQYDMITCIDVTEHLPEDIYNKMINQIKLRLRKDGFLVLMGGTAKLPEHINIKQPDELINDFKGEGFTFIKKLPLNHLLFTI